MSESLNRFARTKLEQIDARELRRQLHSTDRLSAGQVLRVGAPKVSFCCNDYLGLSQHPEVLAAARAALEKFGAGAGGSRLITGNHSLYQELESRLAELKGAEAAVVFGSGYLANLGIIPTLVGPSDLVLVDELAHACLWGGAQLSHCRYLAFRHNDLDHAARLLRDERSKYPHCLVITDGVFSMDGDLAPLPELEGLCREYDAWLLTDDAHGLGVVGAGRGSSFAFADPVPVPLQMGTLSKAVGSYGGYLCASQPLAELMRNRARTFVYSTGLPPSVVAASIAALKLITADPELVRRPVANATAFCRAVGLDAPHSAIVPLLLGTPERALRASDALAKRGFLVSAIRPPTVPPNTSRLRFTFSAAHSEEQVLALAAAVGDLPT